MSKELLPQGRIEREATSIGRFYVTDDGAFPSITTVLSATASNSYLDVWAERIGENNAKRITRASGNRGTQVHKMVENYLQGKHPTEIDDEVSYYNPLSCGLFRSIIPVVDKITDVQMLEGFLYCEKIGIAGTVDCIGKYDGVLSIIDFKTARSVKSEEDITDYFVQASAYSLMAFSRYRIMIRQAVILIAVEHMKEPQVFIVDIKDYAHLVRERLEKFWEINDDYKQRNQYQR